MPSRVLVVEDNAVMREIMLRQLNSFGVNCYAVTSAEEAVELAEFFDLILMDIQLPGISGIEATKRIRKIECEKDMDATAIVATTCADNRSACLAAGMDDYCAKPVKRADLERLLNRWIFSRPEKARLLG
jgi:two-component system, sensor histidine kinase